VPEGDILVYCPPTERLGDKEKLQHFTALGTISDPEIWQADEGEFKPFRRRIRYESVRAVPLQEVSSLLDLTAAPHWGYQLRRGLVPLTPHDLALLWQRMVLELMGTNRERWDPERAKANEQLCDRSRESRPWALAHQQPLASPPAASACTLWSHACSIRPPRIARVVEGNPARYPKQTCPIRPRRCDDDLSGPSRIGG